MPHFGHVYPSGFCRPAAGADRGGGARREGLLLLVDGGFGGRAGSSCQCQCHHGLHGVVVHRLRAAALAGKIGRSRGRRVGHGRRRQITGRRRDRERQWHRLLDDSLGRRRGHNVHQLVVVVRFGTRRYSHAP